MYGSSDPEPKVSDRYIGGSKEAQLVGQALLGSNEGVGH